MATLNKKISIKDCGNTWCDYYSGCTGHTLEMSFTTVTDVGHVDIDGKTVLSGGDTLLLEVANLIKAVLKGYSEIEVKEP